MAVQGGLQSSRDRLPLLAHRGEIASNASKKAGSIVTAEGPGDFLLHVDHAKLSLGKVVVKRDSQIRHEGQYGVLMLAQAIQQIACRMVFGPTSLACWCGNPLMNLVAFAEQIEKRLAKSLHFFGRTPLPCLLYRGVFHDHRAHWRQGSTTMPIDYSE